jgi:16S rRNA (guanine966-N2)-methyltransferase
VPRRDVAGAGVSDAGRVIAGSARGVRLRAPGAGTRPLADRVKQTLFAILEPDLPGARVLDLFAGSGAAGIEALSRGAASAIFVEKDPGAASVIEANLRATSLAGPAAQVVRADVVAWLTRSSRAGGPFDLVVIDPPYAETELLARTLEALGAVDAPLTHGARVVAKHFWRDRPPDRIGLLASERDRRFGETALTFYRREEDR